MYKFILSDLDGVIRHYPMEHRDSIEKEFALPKNALLMAAFQKHLLEPVVTGKTTDEFWREQIVLEVAKLISLADAKKAVTKWSDFPGQLDLNMMRWLNSKRSECSVMLLTNATTKLNKDLNTLGILNNFDKIFNTSEIGHAKPAKESFEFVFNDLKCAPEDIFFIDDRMENVKMAEAMGMQTHHFQNIDELNNA